MKPMIETAELQEEKFSRRKKTFFLIGFNLAFFILILILGSNIHEDQLELNFMAKNLAPSFAHPFGTDALGRDMLLRTLKGLSVSIQIALIATLASLLVSLAFGLLLAIGDERQDAFVSWLIDVFLSIPHMIFLIIISVALGRGEKGVVVGIAATHWTFLTRIIRAEIKQIKTQDYLKVAAHLGKSRFEIAVKHVLPHLLPQIFVATILLFPHAILHEAGISFLGFGLSLSTPAIGIILAESMQYLAQGCWWLAFFPGMMLVCVVRSVTSLGENIKNLLDPYSYHE